MDEELEDIDSTTDETDLQEQETTSEDESTEEAEDVEALRAKNRNLFARAKKAEADLKNLKSQPKQEKPVVQSNKDELLKILDERDLDALELGDELKKEVQTYAKLTGVSIKKALSSDYITFKKDQVEKKQRVEDASLGNKGRATVKRDYSTLKSTDLDLRTPEGQADFAKLEEHMRKELG